jgi:hypothetical protein
VNPATAERDDAPALVAVTTALLADDPAQLEAVLVAVLSGEEEPVELAFRDRTRVRAAARLAASMLPPQRPLLGRAAGPASAWVRRTSAPRRAAYALAAARRLAAREPDVDAERRYLAAHLAAERGRADAALRADAMVARFGPVLGWHAKQPFDALTSPGCRQRHGQNFSPARPPIVEGRPALPGMVHPSCRCSPGPPWPGGRLLAGVVG